MTKNIPLKSRIGCVFGRLTILSVISSSRVLCQCSCGTVKEINAGNLIKGAVKSCGCLLKESAQNNHLRTHSGAYSPEYATWRAMRARCLRPTEKYYKDYGGRGIKVCDRWLNSFENFLNDMGPRPSPRHSIGRIDNDGDYIPSNCRWETPIQQANNTSRCKLVTVNGKTLTVKQWSLSTGLSYRKLLYRVNTGQDVSAYITGTSSNGV